MNIDNKPMVEFWTGLKSDYSIAAKTRFSRTRKGFNPQGSGADYHYRNESDFYRMGEIAWDIYRQDAVIGPGIDRLIDNVIQGGFVPNPMTGDESIDRDLKARFLDWAGDKNQCDLQQTHTFRGMERMALLSMLVAGDICFNPLDGHVLGNQSSGPLEALESHRLRSPTRTKRNIVHGVELDENRRRLRYWFTRESVGPDASLKLGDLQSVDAFDSQGRPNIFHCYLPSRFTQTRGVTVMAAITGSATMLDDLHMAKLVQQQQASLWAWWREKAAGTIRSPVGPAAPAVDGQQTEYVRPGMEIRTSAGEKINAWSPNIPNPEWFEQAKMITQIISVNLKLPLQVLLLDPTQTNFSGWRGAIDQARMSWKCLQASASDTFHTPIWKWKVSQFIDDDPALERAAIRDGINLFSHNWRFPRWSYIQPKEDVQTDIFRYRTGQLSISQILAERGLEWDEVSKRVVDDIAYGIEYAIEVADRLNKQYANVIDEKISWRQLMMLPNPLDADINKLLAGGSANDTESNPALLEVPE